MSLFDGPIRLLPAPASAMFIDPDYFIWCGSMIRASDGTCHLFYSRWPRRLCHNAWVTHSEIAHAVSADPCGPYRHKDVALAARGAEYWDGLCTHNPTVTAYGGKYYLYYMGNTGDGIPLRDLNWGHRRNQRIGVAVAERPDGPWTRFDRPLIEPEPGFHDAQCTTNPSVTARIGGGCLMVYKAVGDRGPLPTRGPVVHIVAEAEDPLGPFVKHKDPVFVAAGVHFPAEDPFIWQTRNGYRAIVKDMAGYFTGAGRSLALFSSGNGIDWEPDAPPLLSTTQILWEGGDLQALKALERPQLWLDGNKGVLFCAASTDDEHSFNVHIPVEVGPAIVPD